jgi:hypothetical protein
VVWSLYEECKLTFICTTIPLLYSHILQEDKLGNRVIEFLKDWRSWGKRANDLSKATESTAAAGDGEL